MPEIHIDDRNFKLYKQCEIRRPSPRGYYFDILWILADLATKGNVIQDDRGQWTIYEVFGSKKMPTPRGDFKKARHGQPTCDWKPDHVDDVPSGPSCGLVATHRIIWLDGSQRYSFACSAHITLDPVAPCCRIDKLDSDVDKEL